jgi:ferredoxin
MYIDESLCEECLDCRPVCPVGAIRLEVLGEKVLSAIAELIAPKPGRWISSRRCRNSWTVSWIASPR